MGYRAQRVSVYLVGSEGVFLGDDAFGCGISCLVAFDVSVQAYFTHCRGLLVIVSSID